MTLEKKIKKKNQEKKKENLPVNPFIAVARTKYPPTTTTPLCAHTHTH
jgi:hypothetical protein